MAEGTYRLSDGAAIGRIRPEAAIPLVRQEYRANGYRPDYDDLPLEPPAPAGQTPPKSKTRPAGDAARDVRRLDA